jgi:hypothetical protein
MNRFSVTFLDKKARLYTCNRDVYTTGLSESRFILCHTRLEDEHTFYVYDVPNDIENVADHRFFQAMCTADPRLYTVINIHEDCPGIDHIGIIHNISGYFLKKQIPILYINTYGHNLILVSDEHLSQVQDIFSEIAYV